MKLAVCDDESLELDNICSLLHRYDITNTISITRYTDGEKLLQQLKTGAESFDLLLLDIEMPLNGFQLAQSILALPNKPLIIFVTKRHEYAVQGYGVAFRYLVKPLDYSIFSTAMDAASQEFQSKRFSVEYDGGALSLVTSDILYLESYGHTVVIHSKAKEIRLRMSIQNAAEQLPKRCFASPHKSYLVNMEHILYTTTDEIILSDSSHLPISRRKKQEFNRAFNLYLGR